MPWNTIARPVRAHSEECAEFMAPKQECDKCNASLAPIWKDDPKVAETWFWTECECCQEPICKDCSDETENGRICVACLTRCGGM